MSNYELTDELLYAVMPDVEARLLAGLPGRIPEHAFSRRFERRMRRMIQREGQSPRMRSFAAFSRRAAAVALALLVMAFGAVMSVQALRVRFFALVSQVFEKYTAITFEQASDVAEQDGVFLPYEIAAIPEGFEKAQVLYEPDVRWQEIVYRNGAGSRISFSQESLETASLSVNTEGVRLEELKINGCEAYYFSNLGMQCVYWLDDTYLFKITTDLDKNTALKLAESTKVVKQ